MAEGQEARPWGDGNVLEPDRGDACTPWQILQYVRDPTESPSKISNLQMVR